MRGGGIGFAGVHHGDDVEAALRVVAGQGVVSVDGVEPDDACDGEFLVCLEGDEVVACDLVWNY